MGFGSSSLFLKIGFILLIVALVIQILGVALPYWYSYEYGNQKTYGGLWRGCSEQGSFKLCYDFDNPADWLAATEAFEIIGLLLIVGALVICVVVIFIKDEKILKLICAIISFCAFGFIIIGIIIFGAEVPNPYDDHLSGAFAITIIAGIVSLAAGILVLLDWLGIGSG